MEFSINDIAMPAPDACEKHGVISFLTFGKQQEFNALDDTISPKRSSVKLSYDRD